MRYAARARIAVLGLSLVIGSADAAYISNARSSGALEAPERAQPSQQVPTPDLWPYQAEGVSTYQLCQIAMEPRRSEHARGVAMAEARSRGDDCSNYSLATRADQERAYRALQLLLLLRATQLR
jgi:hypothetical protein